MANNRRSVAGLAVMMALAGCANAGIGPSTLNEGVGVSYGTIERVTPVNVSPTGEVAGSVMGGLLGLALTAGHSGGSMLLGTAGGALAGGLLGHAMQGSDTADQFVIRRTDGSTLEVATEQLDLEVGDCVAIEQGRHTNLRRAAPGLCDPAGTVRSDNRVALEAQHDAQVCHEAKEDLLNAQGKQAIDAGAQRVKALCQS